MTPDGINWSDLLDAAEREYDSAIAEDAAKHAPPRREDTPAMKHALAEVAACGRASRYAEQCTGNWMADPVGYRRIHRWVMNRLTKGDGK